MTPCWLCLNARLGDVQWLMIIHSPMARTFPVLFDLKFPCHSLFSHWLLAEARQCSKLLCLFASTRLAWMSTRRQLITTSWATTRSAKMKCGMPMRCVHVKRPVSDHQMEVMIAPGTDVPTNYTEIDASPLGALWVGRIHNPTGLHPVNTTSVCVLTRECVW